MRVALAFLGALCAALLAGLVAVTLASIAHGQEVEISPPGRPGIGPTLTCVEPTTDRNGNPLGTVRDGQDNGLIACFGQVGARGQWFPPTSARGGGQHLLGPLMPPAKTDYPTAVWCACMSRLGWGDVRNGRVTFTFRDETPL